MATKDDLEWVVWLACYTEDRAGVEQRSLLNVALSIDCERGSFVSTNTDLREPSYVDLVVDTYDPSTGRRVYLSSQQRGLLDRLLVRWSRCIACRWPLGIHPLDGCPNEWSVRDYLRRRPK